MKYKMEKEPTKPLWFECRTIGLSDCESIQISNGSADGTVVVCSYGAFDEE